MSSATIPGPMPPQISCHRQQGLIIHGQHLSHRCRGWAEELQRSQGWAAQVA